MQDCFIADLDDTLANAKHRRHFLMSNPKDWEGYHSASSHDTVHEHVALVFRALGMRGLPAVICTGRPNTHRAWTDEWLAAKDLIPFILLMRRPGDHRPDPEVKLDMLHEIKHMALNPILALEDRPSVIRMWRMNGVPCLAPDQSHWADHEYESTLMGGRI